MAPSAVTGAEITRPTDGDVDQAVREVQPDPQVVLRVLPNTVIEEALDHAGLRRTHPGGA